MSKKQRNKKLNPNRQITVTVKEIKQLENKASKEATEKAVNVMLLFPLLILRDKYGFGPKRLPEFQGHFQELWDSYTSGYLDLEDIALTLYEEAGVKINVKVE